MMKVLSDKHYSYSTVDIKECLEARISDQSHHTKTNIITPKAVDSICAVILAACEVMAQVYAESLSILFDHIVL